MSLLGAIKQANRDGPPEDSVVFRLAATACVVVAVAACWAQGELSPRLAAWSIGAIVAGNVFSYLRRRRPMPLLKVVLAAAVVAAFVWFFATVTHHRGTGDLATVEGPLAVLFTLIQVTHAFDVPSRRDLGFSLAGSATLMAVAAAQAVDTAFLLYVVVWAAIGIVGLVAMWSSMVGSRRVSGRALGFSAAAVAVVTVVAVALLPAPHAASSIVFPSALAGDAQLSTPAALVGGGPRGTDPLQAGSPSGPTRVGGFLGMAGPLDTAIRGTLSNQVVFRVRADRPTFWVAETFDAWNGRGWSQTPPRPGRPVFFSVDVGPPFTLPVPSGEVAQGKPDLQTFYVVQTGANLILHAANATQVWFPAQRLFVADDGTIRAGTSMGAGSIYTVESAVNTATPDQLRAAGSSPFAGSALDPPDRARYTQLPHSYPQVAALAAAVTADQPTVYDKVTALEAWIGAHTRYTTDIPPLAPGQDTVTEFLFGNRRGYCEQISTALTVMLRTLGIPAREATGYVPGPFNPLTDLYDVQAKDAHAWVQVWFPGYGWQSFDPTASVPVANPSPAAALAHDARDAVGRLPLVPLGVALAAAVAGLGAFLFWRRTPATWAAAVTRQLERAGRRAGLAEEPGQSLLTLGARLDDLWPPGQVPPPGARALAVAAEQAAYGTGPPDPETRRQLLGAAKRLAREARRRRGEVSPPPAPEPRPTSPRPTAGVGRP
jgi:transglutaminase-like putative cysteine protease